VGRRRASYRLQKKPYQTLVINNRYDLLSPNERHGSETGTSRAVQQLKTRDDYNKKTSNKKQNKIIILGVSHVRGCAQEVQRNLGHNFEVQGIVKPEANTEIIVNTSPKITRTLTKKDVVFVWGGTRDVGRNETKKGLHHLVSNHKQTNVIVMSVPCRYDLDISSERKSAERFNLDEDESTRNNRKLIVAYEQECDGEEEDANKDGTVIREQAQDIADTTQPGNVDETTEACRTSTRNKKNPSIRGKVFFYGERGI